MKRIALVATVAAVLFTAQFAAALGPLCCACLPKSGWATSGTNGTLVSALFCAQAPPASPSELEQRCEATPDYALECIPVLPGTPCVSELAEGGIQCPAAGAPAATPATLLTLAVTLTAAGMFAARRRQRRS